MCLILSFVFSYLSYSFYEEGDMINALINAIMALLFIGLLVRNILKVRQRKKE